MPAILPSFLSTSEWKLAPGQRLAKASSFGSAARQVRQWADANLITDMLSFLAPASSSSYAAGVSRGAKYFATTSHRLASAAATGALEILTGESRSAATGEVLNHSAAAPRMLRVSLLARCPGVVWGAFPPDGGPDGSG